jgi:hypothetical protein
VCTLSHSHRQALDLGERKSSADENFHLYFRALPLCIVNQGVDVFVGELFYSYMVTLHSQHLVPLCGIRQENRQVLLFVNFYG